jgi:hypothetical protein
VLLARAPVGTLRVLADGERLKLGAIGRLLAQPVIVGNKEAAKNIASNWKRSDFRTKIVFVS